MIRIGNFTVDEFKEQIKEKRMICFCAGQKFRELYNRYQPGRKLLYVVDNFIDGQTIRVGDRNVPVRRMEEIGDEIRDCLLLITSMKYADQIIKQLDKMLLCNGLFFYIPELFTEDEDVTEFDIEGSKVEKIPKVIHYCWFGTGRIPEVFQRNIETWRRYCQDYEIIRWDESNYDVSRNLYMRQAYEAKKWGFVSDYARLEIIYDHGGIYFDTDVEVLRPLDSLLNYELFCGFESSEYIAFGLGFGATKHNKIIKDILGKYDSMQFIDENGDLNLTVSPIYQTDVLEKYGLIRNGRTQVKKDFIALAPEYLSPITSLGLGRPTARSFSIHQYAATWFDENQKIEKKRKMNKYRNIVSRMEEQSHV